ncbi:hypothetical protein RRG08_003283 [Elysia crispata]|uniref:Uncharacterized protein n=1 Tax=Elysia crispata TaxID=231223 RepID=A0AAE0YKP9_9GAST|nr:hypothetical protein RRG08_003283 [Elysia crispata]
MSRSLRPHRTWLEAEGSFSLSQLDPSPNQFQFHEQPSSRSTNSGPDLFPTCFYGGLFLSTVFSTISSFIFTTA